MNATAADAEFIVIGSGPAGVSAALPLVEAGRRVLMLDGASTAAFPTEAIPDWQRALGEDLVSLVPHDELSPKLAAPTARRVIGRFAREAHIHGDGIMTIGSLARGGLSQVWGAGVGEFEEADLAGWPFPIHELRDSYRMVAGRIGISGRTDDEMAPFHGLSATVQPAPPLGPAAARVLAGYTPGQFGGGFRLGAARNALRTIAGDHGRGACDLRQGCLWGCPRGAIYDARYDLKTLGGFPAFRLVDGAVAESLAPRNGGWEVATRDGRRFRAGRILLAAGCLGSTRLAIPLLQHPPAELRLLTSPVLAMPLLVLSRLGRAAPERGHSLAHLAYSYRFDDRPDHQVVGCLYEIAALPGSPLVARMPVGRRAGTVLFDALAPALLVATAYFSGAWSDDRVRWAKTGAALSLAVTGRSHPGLPGAIDAVVRGLRPIWRNLGAWMLPGSALAPSGADAHFGGTLPMGAIGANGTTAYGELHGAVGVHVVDGAALPSMPAKFLTLTIMANADRIARHLSQLTSRR